MSWSNLANMYRNERLERARGGSVPRKYTRIDDVEFSLPELQRSEHNVHGLGMTTLHRRWAKGLRGRDLLGPQQAAERIRLKEADHD
jgi:hypothetical protein